MVQAFASRGPRDGLRRLRGLAEQRRAALAFVAEYLFPPSGNPPISLDGSTILLVEYGTQSLIIILFLPSRACLR